MYDKYGMEGIKQNLSSDDGNGFPFFGGRSQRPRRTQDIVHDYPVKLEDLYKGKTAKFRVTHKIVFRPVRAGVVRRAARSRVPTAAVVACVCA